MAVEKEYAHACVLEANSIPSSLSDSSEARPSSLALTLLCAQLLTRLQDRKVAVERECARLPAAPKGKDIFHLCRGFERAFSHVVEVCSASLWGRLHSARARACKHWLLAAVLVVGADC